MPDTFTHPLTFDWVDKPDELETDRMPRDNLKLVRGAKLEMLKALRRQFAIDHLETIPRPGVSVHIVTNGRYDFWDFVPALLKLAEPAVIQEFYASTWILNRRNAVEMLELFDQGKIRKIGFLTGIYFKRRESAVFATLYEGLKARGQRFKACLNHAKFFTMLDTTPEAAPVNIRNRIDRLERRDAESNQSTMDRYLAESKRLDEWLDQIGLTPAEALARGLTPPAELDLRHATLEIAAEADRKLRDWHAEMEQRHAEFHRQRMKELGQYAQQYAEYVKQTSGYVIPCPAAATP